MDKSGTGVGGNRTAHSPAPRLTHTHAALPTPPTGPKVQQSPLNYCFPNGNLIASTSTAMAKMNIVARYRVVGFAARIVEIRVLIAAIFCLRGKV